MTGRRQKRERAMGFELVFVLTCFWACNPIHVHANTNTKDVSSLNVLYTYLNSPTQLTGWTANGGDPCGQSWLGITCSGSSVTAIKLSGKGLNGNLGYNMADMTSLVELDLSNNNLGSGGNQIPYGLPPNLTRINLAQNQFTGGIPYSFSQMTALSYINLGHNQFSNSLNDIFFNLSNLTFLDLSFNTFTGNLPNSFSSLIDLATLHLQNNQFSGTIDVLANLPLKDLNIENNHFTGWIPAQLQKINPVVGGNSFTSGPAPPPPPYTAPPPPPPGGRKPTPSINTPVKKSGLNGGAVAGIVLSFLALGAVIAGVIIIFIRRKLSKISKNQGTDEPLTRLASNEYGGSELKSFKIEAPKSSLSTSVSLKPPVKIDLYKSFDEKDLTMKPILKKISFSSIRATVYSVADLQVATDMFSPDNLLGEGSFGRSFKAQFDGGKLLAVKKISRSALPNQSSDDFAELVSNISLLHHANLTELTGYCNEHGQRLLVYEFCKNGSLHDFIYYPEEHGKSLSWNNRVKIALGSARALEYLHETCSPSVLHKNFKSSNILLDGDLNPHLSDSGFADLIANPDSQAAEASSGYNAPEVVMSGQYNLKSDVFSFGVVMLELLTGRKPFDSSRPRSEQSLVRWATPQLHDIDALDHMVDPGLKGLYPAKSLSRFADVIALCVQSEPEFRPPMSEVVQALVILVQRANMTKRVLNADGPDTESHNFV
ncbi:Protein STRUBBELIG-RECEPTOR FAMILY 6 [Carex littledalei]|uniref:Protein STRUBBELIG-RECEPTOR FAMILY 6 n=1 Tax=Carex littledalei TaxID=544730 RepID=A0A833QPS8_9POAL|nr:Protein STRUBBELIG-RECEPTOR FAMILY 6 [Carex littledalei]